MSHLSLSTIAWIIVYVQVTLNYSVSQSIFCFLKFSPNTCTSAMCFLPVSHTPYDITFSSENSFEFFNMCSLGKLMYVSGLIHAMHAAVCLSRCLTLWAVSLCPENLIFIETIQCHTQIIEDRIGDGLWANKRDTGKKEKR